MNKINFIERLFINDEDHIRCDMCGERALYTIVKLECVDCGTVYTKCDNCENSPEKGFLEYSLIDGSVKMDCRVCNRDDRIKEILRND